MIRALGVFIVAQPVLLEEVFDDIYGVKRVTVDGQVALRELLVGGGLPSVAAVDLTRHLSQRAQYIGDVQSRAGIWLMVSEAQRLVSPLELCLLPGFVYVRPSALLADVQHEIAVGVRAAGGRVSWISLMKARKRMTETPVTSSSTFKEVFIARVRQHLVRRREASS
jgi:hypothetical protein